MPSVETHSLLVVLVGPTGVGKTALSIDLAKRLDAEIVSADSRLFYKGMDIGTAKPTLEERRGVPHHLIDIANPDETWSLALFQSAARNAINEIRSRGKLPVLVGGTGQYVRAITEEWRLPNQPPDLVLRQILEKWAGEIGPQGLYARLAAIDPVAAQAIEPRNLRRTIRALEVIFHSGKLFSQQRQKLPSPYERIQIGLYRPREELYARIDARIDAMLNNGLVAEVNGLLAHGYSPDLPSLSAIGYREIIGYLHGEYSLDEAVVLMKRATRQFVRRQSNWFKLNDPAIHWFRAGEDILDDLVNLIRKGERINEQEHKTMA